MVLGRKLFGLYFLLFVFVNTSSLHATEVNVMPSSGTCSFMINLPVPYGVDISTRGGGTSNHPFGTYDTGGSLMGTITFTSSAGGSFTGTIVNPLYQVSESPSLRSVDNVFFNGGTITITAMTAADGFVGGYKMVFRGTATGSDRFIGRVGEWEANVLPSNNGKTLLIQLANNTLPNENYGIGPGTGVCQF